MGPRHGRPGDAHISPDYMPLMFLRSNQVLQPVLGEDRYLTDAELKAILPAGNGHTGVGFEGIEGVGEELVIIRDDGCGIISRTGSHPGDIGLVVEHVSALEKTPDKHRRGMKAQSRFDDPIFRLDLFCRGTDLFSGPSGLEFLTE
jgi:hypothetical protein